MQNSTTKLVYAQTARPEDTDEALMEKATIAITHHARYFERNWTPLLRGNVAAVITALLKRCSFAKQHAQTWPSHATIANDAGVSERTVRNILHRDPVTGQFDYTYYGQDIGQHIERFVLAIEHRWRYVSKLGHSLQSSNVYTVAVVMPPVPADEELVRLKYQQLLADREATQGQQDQAGPSPEKKDCRHYARQNLPSLQAATLAGESNGSEMTISGRGTTSISNERASSILIAARTIGNAASGDEPAAQGNERRDTDTQESNRHLSNREIAAVRGQLDYMFDEDEAEARAVPTEAMLSEAATLRIEADVEAGDLIEDIATQLGDKNAKATRAIVIREAVAAGAPIDELRGLARLAKHRIARHQSAGGPPIANLAGYYLRTIRNAIQEAKRGGWKVSEIEERDRVRQGAKAKQEKRQAYQKVVRHGNGF